MPILSPVSYTHLDGVPWVGLNDLLGIPNTAHILGGCAIGADEHTGVVDVQQQVFNYPGLYVADGSVVPTNPVSYTHLSTVVESTSASTVSLLRPISLRSMLSSVRRARIVRSLLGLIRMSEVMGESDGAVGGARVGAGVGVGAAAVGSGVLLGGCLLYTSCP